MLNSDTNNVLHFQPRPKQEKGDLRVCEEEEVELEDPGAHVGPGSGKVKLFEIGLEDLGSVVGQEFLGKLLVFLVCEGRVAVSDEHAIENVIGPLLGLPPGKLVSELRIRVGGHGWGGLIHKLQEDMEPGDKVPGGAKLLGQRVLHDRKVDLGNGLKNQGSLHTVKLQAGGEQLVQERKGGGHHLHQRGTVLADLESVRWKHNKGNEKNRVRP